MEKIRQSRLFVVVIYIIIILVCGIFISQTKFVSHSQTSTMTPIFMQGRVQSIVKGKQNQSDIKNVLQVLNVQLTTGKDKEKTVQVSYDPQNVSENEMHIGDSIVVMREADGYGHTQYFINDRYRILRVIAIASIFLLIVLFIAGWKGFGSLVGLIVSITVIFSYVLPSILSGQDPLTVCFYASLIILFVTTYLAHGFSLQTTIALFATFVSLLLTLFIAKFVVTYALLSGYGSDSAYDLRFSGQTLINMKGLLLGGIMIATVGALNDMTTTQAATVFEMIRLNKHLTFKDLYQKSFSVGREHAISLVNTLVLAYAGSSLAIFIIFFYNPQGQPYWTMVNSEVISEEIVKTLAGTTGLMLSLPLVTLFAVMVCNNQVRNFLHRFASSLVS